MKKQYVTLALLGIVLLLGFLLYQQHQQERPTQSAQEMDKEYRIEMSNYDPPTMTTIDSQNTQND